MVRDEQALQERVKQLEAELQRSRDEADRLRFLMEFVPDYVTFVGADRRLMFNNPGSSHWFPVGELTEIDGLRLGEVIGDKAMTAIEPHLEHVESGRDFLFYGPVQYEEKDLRHVRIDYRPMTNEDGVYLGFGAHVEDLTARHHEEDRLRRAAVVFETARDAIVILNASHEVVQVNHAFGELTGYDEDEVVGQRPWNLTVPGRQALDVIWDVIRTQGEWQGELWQRRKDGSLGGVWVHVNAVADNRGEIHNYVAVLSDLESKSNLSHLAHYDALTGLPNRLLLEARLQHTLEHAERTQGKAAVLFMDLDGFKAVNDNYGHDQGDLVLTEIGKRLKTTVRAIDTVARLGGDEFVIILDQVSGLSDACEVANRVLSVMGPEFDVAEGQAQVGVSIGVSVYPYDADDAAMLLKRADVAMYAAKKAGKSQWATYLPELGDEKSYVMAGE